VDDTIFIVVAAAVIAVLLIALVIAVRIIRRGRRATATVVDQAFQLGEQAVQAGAARLAPMVKSSIEGLAARIEAERPSLRRVAGADGTVTMMFSDIEDSTVLNHELGDRGWVKLLKAHDKVVHDRVTAHEGEVVKEQGDGFMVAFPSSVHAVKCAIEMQRAFDSGRGRLKKTPIRVRIGIHAGKAIERKGDYYGRNIAMAARVAQSAEGGEILASEAVTELAGDTEELRFGTAREVELKGFPGSHQLVPVEWAVSDAN
jgi:class 3 adenylate cyclase